MILCIVVVESVSHMIVAMHTRIARIMIRNEEMIGLIPTSRVQLHSAYTTHKALIQFSVFCLWNTKLSASVKYCEILMEMF